MASTIADRDMLTNTAVASATRMALVLEYDGTRYHGFQWQADRQTIQAEVERALEKLTGERIRAAAAGRTDAGVHARGQVVSFRTSSSLSRRAFVQGLNFHLPEDIAIKAAYVVDEAFDVRRDAVSRHYRYQILNSGTRSPLAEGFAYRVAGELDIAAMSEACRSLVGEHDFASFASGLGGQRTSTVRRVYQAKVSRSGNLVAFDMVANAFLRHQVRTTAGCLVRVGLGKMRLEEFREVLAARQPGLAGPTLPARGLCLVRVSYPRPFEE